MAAVFIDSREGGVNQRDLIGTAAELSEVDITLLAPGSTYWATDTKTGYVLDGAGTWCAL